MHASSYRPNGAKALVMSDLHRTLRTRLAGGTVQFTFRKIDGTMRPATGTTVLDLIPADHRPKGIIVKPRSEDIVTYYDLERMAWRSCRSAEVISIDD